MLFFYLLIYLSTYLHMYVFMCVYSLYSNYSCTDACNAETLQTLLLWVCGSSDRSWAR